MKLSRFVSACIALLASTSALITQAATSEERLAALESKLATLEHRLLLQEDVESIRVLAFSYG